MAQHRPPTPGEESTMNSSAGILHHQTGVGYGDPVGVLRRRSDGLRRLLVTWQTRARQRRQLRELDDRLLADVGISRAAALTVGRTPFWRA
jgi:uncharacterized protein YjiS (DUF1127 family)